MGQKSSINFKPSKDHQVFHNTTIRPNYAIGGELEYDLKGYPARDLKNKIISQAIENYNKNKAPKAPKFKAKNYEWSAVVNIKPETTMDDLKKLAQHLNKKYGFQCYQITIHRDEGHINDDGEKEINHHAHLELITLDKETGKQRWNFTPKKLRELQTEVAEILQMERGIDKRISGAKRIEPRVYAEMKEKERANQKALKKELETIEVSGSKAFCDEVARQIAEIKAKEKAEQERKLKELEQENERLKAELANNRTETALETQNEPKPSQDITQSEKTQENAPKAKSQAQIDLEIAQRLDKKPIWEQTDTRTFYNILQRLEMRQEQQILERKLNEPKISCPGDFTSYAINKLNELIAKEIEKEKEQPKSLSDDEKRREAELKEIERLKAQGKFNLNSTKSQSQEKGRKF